MATFREKLDRYRGALVEGSVIRCTINERIPDRVGVELVVSEIGVSYLKGSVEVDPTGRLKEGATYWCNLPTRATELVSVDETGILYKLAPGGELCGWEVVV